jgi:outer membrane receptor protein involved in Fe transport
MFLDDANQLELPNWSRWDARLSYTRNELQLFADLLNLADAEFSTTGFPDPQGGGEVFYYPAAGRTLHVGVRWGR